MGYSACNAPPGGRTVPILHESVRKAVRLTDNETTELAGELQAKLAGDVRVDRYSRLLYATDASMYQMEPVGVVLPREAQDVVEVVRIAGSYGVPVLPRGGGTGLVGGTVNHAIVLDFSKYMNGVTEVHPEERWALVQPGLVVNHLNQDVATHGLQYAPDPVTSNRATIGGGIGTNSCGAHSVIYGKTIDHILGVEVVLTDGSSAQFGSVTGAGLDRKLGLESLEGQIYREVRRIAHAHREEVAHRFPRILRRVSGYNLDEFAEDGPMDLTKMVVGSEGTLAVVTAAQVNLVPIPHRKGVAALHFRGIVEAMEATMAILGHGPSAVELVGGTIIRRCREARGFRHLLSFVEGEPDCLLLVEFYGDTEQEVDARLTDLRRDLERRGLGYATVSTTDPAQQQQMWELRRAGLGLVMSVRGDLKPLPFVEDTAVSPEKLPAYVARFMEIVGRNGTEAAYYGHASTGCLHIRPMVNVKRQEGLATMQRIASEVADLVLEFGGSLSGEHGDGIVRGVFAERMFGTELVGAFRELKGAFDPGSLLNPGKIIDTPALTENLRLSPETRTFEPPTFMDFSADGGMTGLVELCNGQGACRKLDGAMCPSFMVTREEEHSTRGRANLLRMVLSGVLPASELAGERLHGALDLCVECKACKAECPSGVDMAKLKAEVLTRYRQVHGVPLRSRLFGRIDLLGKLGSATVPLSNWALGFPPLRLLLHHFLGIHRDRPLPPFARQTFSAWFQGRPLRPAADAPRGEVVLFNDTHMEFYQPEVGQAATRVLETLGFRVTLVRGKRCCGRPLISQGMLGTAKEWAQTNVDALLPYAQRGIAIVGTEPSCLLTFRDEYPDLLGNEATRAVASQTFLLEEFLLQVAGQDPLAASMFRNDVNARVLVHGHCHQKALVGLEPTLRALNLVPGYTTELVDSGCCGMAGAFGFEVEHYDMSRAMGAHQLFPALEAAMAGVKRVAITGVSCRQQINHFTPHRPRHVAELLADALK
jgi:FAD/FMN-containing dehydrogenase/Fe-S oxidoreductase